MVSLFTGDIGVCYNGAMFCSKNGRRGATSIEYGLIAALLAVATIGAVMTLGKQLSRQYMLQAAIIEFYNTSKVGLFTIAFDDFCSDGLMMDEAEFTSAMQWWPGVVGQKPLPPEEYPFMFDEFDKDDDDKVSRDEFVHK